MKIATKAVFDIETMQLLEWQGYDYNGPIACLKHGDEKKKADTAYADQAAMQKLSFETQAKTLADLKSSFGKYLGGTQGFDPAQLAALKTQFLGQNAKDFGKARSGVMSALASRGGGNMPVGGDFTRGLSSLYGGEASNLSSGLTGIKLQDLSQALTNQMNAGSILSGNAATLNSPISSFGAGASNALNERISIGTQPGFFQSLGTSLASGLGSGLGVGLTGGIGSGLFGLSSIFKRPSSSGASSGGGGGWY